MIDWFVLLMDVIVIIISLCWMISTKTGTIFHPFSHIMKYRIIAIVTLFCLGITIFQYLK